MTEECIFCGIQSGKIPTEKIYEDDDTEFTVWKWKPLAA